MARFDNRNDLTTFVREDQKLWKPAEVQAIHSGLKAAFDQLAKRTEPINAKALRR